MVYLTCWDRAQVRSVFTTESRQKVRELFLQTHRPFRHIRVDFCKEADLNGAFVDEDQVRVIIEGGALDAHNRLFFVVGEAGSGKSELCQWLEYMVDRRVRLPIHVPRSMTSAAHVAALLKNSLGAEATAPLQHTPVALQADHVALSATLLLYEQTESALVPAHRWEPLLGSATLKSAIAKHLEAAARGDAVLPPLSDPMTFEALCAAHDITLDDTQRGIAHVALRRLVEQGMEQALWLGDLRALLGQISTRAAAQGRRPLLLLEDITAFRVLGDRLLDYLLDLTSGHFDALIGVTTGFERTQLAGATLEGDLTHIHHRLRARFVLTDDQGRSYGLEDDVVDLARGYLRAVKPDCAVCTLQRTCDTIFGDGLYPFTAIALRRAFHHLQEEGNPRQTPRLFLEHVVGATLLAETPPPATLDRSPYLVQPPTLFRSDEVADAGLRALLRWYGDVGNDRVTLDRHLADFWDVPVGDTVVDGNTIQATRAYVTPAHQANDMRQDWQQELRELQQWLTGGELYPSRETLKRGIERALLALGDPRLLGSPNSLSLAKAEIAYARGDERLPIFLGRASGDQPATRTSLKVHVTGEPGERAILEELAYLALSGDAYAPICHNLALTMGWASEHWDEYNEQVRGLLRDQLGGIDDEHLVLMAWQMLATLQGAGREELPDLREQPDLHGRYAAISPWSAFHHPGCYSAGEDLIGWYDIVRRLFIGSFTLRDTLIDRDRYQAACGGFNASEVLERLERLPLLSLRATPFRIRPGGHKLYGFLVPLQRYAHALRRFDVHAALKEDLILLQKRAAHLMAQQALDIDYLRTRLAALHWRCGEVGVTWREAWDDAIETLEVIMPTVLGELRDQASAHEATAQALISKGCDVWRYQIFRHAQQPVIKHPYWAAVETVYGIQSELLRAARLRYRGSSRALTGTQEYKDLLATIRAVRQELLDERHVAD